MCDQEDLVVCSSNPVTREEEKRTHGNGSQLAIPEVVFGPVSQEMREAVACLLLMLI